MTPSAPRSRTAAAAWRARFRRAVALPRIAFWTLAWVDVQANTETVRTTRVPRWCAALMTAVIDELVQPPHPVVLVPSASFFLRLPFEFAPTEK